MSTVEIFCTGTARADHRKIVIVRLFNKGGKWCEWHWDREGEPGAIYIRGTVEELVEADGRYPLWCRRCAKRNTRVTPETLTKALDGIAAAGGESLDIRHLPF